MAGKIQLTITMLTLLFLFCRAASPRAMESMVEENGSAIDPLASASPSNDAVPTIASVQSLRGQPQTHHLVASTSIVQLIPSSGTTQVTRRSQGLQKET